MKGIQLVDEPNNKEINRKMFKLASIASIPLLVALVAYLSNPDSELLRSISVATNDFPALMSVKNPLLSSVLNAWCKTAPLWALIFVVLSANAFQVKKDMQVGIMVKTLIAFSVLYLPIMYILLLHSAEMTESGVFAQTMSQNDYLLTFFFIVVNMICFIFTTYYLLFIAAVLKLHGKKTKLDY